MKDGKDTVRLIYKSTQKIADFIADLDLDDFLEDSKTQSAVIMQLVVIGEPAKSLDESIRANIELPWKSISGFRDFAVHDYFSLGLPKVWETLTVDIPEMAQKMAAFLRVEGVEL